MSHDSLRPRGTELALSNERLIADRSGALYWPAERTLIVADLHLEKASFFASRGVMLPPYDTAATLEALSEALAAYEPARVIALGDSFHDTAGGARLSPEKRATVHSLQHERDWVWICGNHDPEHIKGIGGDFSEVLRIGNLAFQHQPGSGAFEVVGHFHPVAKVQVRERTVRRRCFAASKRKIVLPAFGSLTGGFNIRDRAFLSIMGEEFSAHILGTDQVFTFAAVHCLPD